MLAMLPLQKAQALVLLMCAFGCNNDTLEQTATLRTQLNVWFHADTPYEEALLREQVSRFNSSREDIEVALSIVPEQDYPTLLAAAVHEDSLPDILEFNGPQVYEYIQRDILLPLDNHLPEEVLGDLLPSVFEQGAHMGRLYSVSATDSGLALYADRQRLKEIGARIPYSPAEGWTVDEFNAILANLAATDQDGAVLDLKLNSRGNWYSFAFSPLLLSAGADLIDRINYSAEGILNSDGAVEALEQLQGWVDRSYVDPNTDNSAFTSRRVALSWAGPSDYQPYRNALGEDLVIVPLPNFGHGSMTGQGGWSLGISKDCKAPSAAGEFLSFLLSSEEVLATADRKKTIPSTRSALAKSPLYSQDGPMRLFSEQLLQGHGVPPPATHASGRITSILEEALRNIIAMSPVRETLNEAVRKIERDLNQ